MPTADDRARTLLTRATPWENHACLPFKDMGYWAPSLERYRAAGFRVVHVNVGDSDIGLEETIGMLAFLRSWVRARPDQFALVTRVEDVDALAASGRLGICFDLEGLHGVGDRVELVSLLYDLGVRWALLAYNRGNLAGGGCHDAVDQGLTSLGRRLVLEMERVGMVVDLAHTGDRTALDICAIATRPVTISHSNPRSIKSHPRCVTDELMRACAATGGVLGISGVGIFLGDNDISTGAVVRSIERAVEVMGIDHVGLGLDYVFNIADLDEALKGQKDIWPAGYDYRPGIGFVEPERILELTGALLARGFGEDGILKILGGNFLRVARKVWK